MSELDPFGAAFGPVSLTRAAVHYWQTEAAFNLRCALEFTRHSLNDMINDPSVRKKVTFYYKLFCYMERYSDEVDAQRRWRDGRVSL